MLRSFHFNFFPVKFAIWMEISVVIFLASEKMFLQFSQNDVMIIPILPLMVHNNFNAFSMCHIWRSSPTVHVCVHSPQSPELVRQVHMESNLRTGLDLSTPELGMDLNHM